MRTRIYFSRNNFILMSLRYLVCVHACVRACMRARVCVRVRVWSVQP